MLFHQFQKPQCAFAVEKEIFVHHEERTDVHVLFHLAHDVEQFVAGLIKMHAIAFAAEHRRGGAKIAAQRTADRRNDRGGNVAVAFLHRYADISRAKTRCNHGMAHGLIHVLAQILPEPPHALALDYVIGVDPLVQVGYIGNVPADDDHRIWAGIAESVRTFF